MVIIDTAGRLTVDQALMDEIRAVGRAVEPTETLLVVDAMVGQEAVPVAEAFRDAVPLTGLVLTKIDGDARGGAALSISAVTGVPVKFLGTGEKTDALEVFHPDRLAGRILGMGDVLTPRREGPGDVRPEAGRADGREAAQEHVHARGLSSSQMQQLKKMGPLGSLMEMIPGMGGMKDARKRIAGGGGAGRAARVRRRSSVP